MRPEGLQTVFYRTADSRITVCLLLDDNVVLARGVAICCPHDQIVKRIGRDKARGRAVQAVWNESSTGIIVNERFAHYNHTAVPEAEWDFSDHAALHQAAQDFGVKSCWLPELTEYEKTLLDKTG